MKLSIILSVRLFPTSYSNLLCVYIITKKTNIEFFEFNLISQTRESGLKCNEILLRCYRVEIIFNSICGFNQKIQKIYSF